MKSIIKKSIFIILSLFSFLSFGFASSNPISSVTDYTKDFIISDETIESLPTELESRVTYNFDIFLQNQNEEYCEIRILDENEKSVDYNIIPKIDGHYKKSIYATKKGKYLKIVFKYQDEPDKLIGKFNLVDPTFPITPILQYNSQTKFYDFTIDNTNYEDIPESIKSGCIYNFKIDTDIIEKEFCTCIFSFYKERNLLYAHSFFERDEPFLIFISSDTDNFSIDFTHADQIGESRTLAFIKVEKNNHPYKFKLPRSYKNVQQYNTGKPDERLISFFKEMDLREKAKTEPEEVLNLCIEKINELSANDFEKVKLIHDTAYYFARYDMEVFEQQIRKPQDYRTVLQTGLCVCEGYTKLSSKMFSLVGITSIESIGHANYDKWKNESFQKVGFDQRLTHIWNIIQIDGCWYFYDVTFDTGPSEENYLSDYIFIEPEDFIYKHLPFCKELTLMKVTDKKYAESEKQYNKIFSEILGETEEE